MTKSKGIGRGNNSASHKNRPIIGGEQTKVYLLPHQKEIAKELGGGNQSDGVRKIIDLYSRDYSQLPASGKVAAILLRAQSASEPKKSKLITEALEYLKSWSVEKSW